MKKYISLILCIVCILPFSSCKREDRFDLSELNIRLERADKKYTFDYENIFFSDSVFYIYYSFAEENDVLMTVKEDSELKLIRISAALWRTANEESIAEYERFCEVLTQVFVSEKQREGLLEETGLFSDGVLFSDFVSVTEKTDYTARAFSSEFGAVYVLEFNIY